MTQTISAPKREQNKLDSIQVLRAVAALLVVFLHANDGVLKKQWTSVVTPIFAESGGLGVDIFFVVSGFVMIVTTQNRGSGFAVAREFMLARLARIVPMYWMLTTMYVLLLLLVPAKFSEAKFDLPHAIASYFFIPFNNFRGEPYPVLHVGWTLTYEMWFYMVFAILMCFTRQYIFPILAIFFSGLSALSVLGSENLLMKTFTSTLMLEFVFGCGIGVLYLRDTVFSRNLPILFMAAGMLLFPFLSLYFPDLDRCIVLGIPSALLILGAVFLERKGSWPNFPIMHRIGDSSYSLYLTHIFTLPIVMGILLKIDAKHSLHGDLVCVALVFVAAFVGYAVHKLVEKPVDQYLRGLLISRADGGVP